jgi:hypothetical protein
MRNIPKKIRNEIKENKEAVENVSSCRNNNCRDRLIASVALKSIGKYRRRVKFDGGGV